MRWLTMSWGKMTPFPLKKQWTGSPLLDIFPHVPLGKPTQGEGQGPQCK